MEARLPAPVRLPAASRLVPAIGFAALGLTVAVGLGAKAAGVELGTASPPLLYRLDPQAGFAAVPVATGFAALAVLAPKLCSVRISPLRFVAAALALGLLLRLGLALARGGGLDAWWAVYVPGNVEAASEYLPALPALDFGLRPFLDRFAEVGPSLPVNAVGHPPGLLVSLDLLGIERASRMAALTVGVGALSIPLAYVLARQLIGEGRARIATLLYVFAPSAVLHGATSADALYATLALGAAIPLVAAGRLRWAGPGALALASFFSYANLAVGAWATALRALRGEVRRAIALALACAAALVLFYALLYALSGFDPVGAIRSAESVYREGVASGRPYFFWLFGAPAAFLVAAGLPIAWHALRSLGDGHETAVALFGVLAVAALLGFSKSETERIYLYLVPLLCIAAAQVLPTRRLGVVLGALAAQAIATELLFFTVW